MEQAVSDVTSIDARIAERLRALRAERGWSLEVLAKRARVSRATLSRLENAEVSATASVLGRLCRAHGLTLSQLLHRVEDAFAPLVRSAEQTVWTDPATGFCRRIVSPPSATLAGEVVEGTLRPGARVAYDGAPRAGLEHHLVLLEGGLELTIGDRRHGVRPGDCLRYRLDGPSRFDADPETGARYLLFIV